MCYVCLKMTTTLKTRYKWAIRAHAWMHNACMKVITIDWPMKKKRFSSLVWLANKNKRFTKMKSSFFQWNSSLSNNASSNKQSSTKSNLADGLRTFKIVLDTAQGLGQVHKKRIFQWKIIIIISSFITALGKFAFV